MTYYKVKKDMACWQDTGSGMKCKACFMKGQLITEREVLKHAIRDWVDEVDVPKSRVRIIEGARFLKEDALPPFIEGGY